MQSTSDARLLRDYAADGSEAAFAELVRRHADLVYSAALRQVDSPDQARDVAQAVFTDLARKAPVLIRDLTPDASVVGWLYRGARYEALTLRRGELRRRLREQQAMENLDSSDAPADWDALRPLLDEAMDDLEPADRDALLLRYFQNRDLRTVGAAFGISDDAAQKRVSRAVDKLRAVLAGRGVVAPAAGLAVVLSAHAVQAAPAGLAAALVSVSVASPAVLATTVHAILMTTTQKVLLGTVLATVVGTGVFEVREAAQLRREVTGLREAQTPLNTRIAELEAERAKLSNLVAALNAENDRLQGQASAGLKLQQQAVQLADKTQREVSGADPDVQEALKWKTNKEKLQQLFKDNPEWWVPEMALVTDVEWLDAARLANLQSAAGIAQAKREIRVQGERKYIQGIAAAVVRFMDAHDHQRPEALSDAAPYFQGPGQLSWLERYKVIQGDPDPNQPNNPRWRIVQTREFDASGDVRISMDLRSEGGFSGMEQRTEVAQ